jgi:hypothetical protein
VQVNHPAHRAGHHKKLEEEGIASPIPPLRIKKR